MTKPKRHSWRLDDDGLPAIFALTTSVTHCLTEEGWIKPDHDVLQCSVCGWRYCPRCGIGCQYDGPCPDKWSSANPKPMPMP